MGYMQKHGPSINLFTYHGPQARPCIKNSASHQRIPHPMDTEDSINKRLQSLEIKMYYLYYTSVTWKLKKTTYFQISWIHGPARKRIPWDLIYKL